MLLGQLPGQPYSGSPMIATLPTYATAMAQFLSRFGPYRLQPYPLSGIPNLSPFQPIPSQTVRVDKPEKAALERHWLREPNERGGNGRSAAQGRSSGRMGV